MILFDAQAEPEPFEVDWLWDWLAQFFD